MTTEHVPEMIKLLTEIRDLLWKQEQERPKSIPLPEFCQRLGRSTAWGREQIRLRTLIPDRTGTKPYRVNVNQLKNFT